MFTIIQTSPIGEIQGQQLSGTREVYQLTTLDPSRHSVVTFTPPTPSEMNPTNETSDVDPSLSLERLRHDPDKGRTLSMHKLIQKVKRSIRSKKGLSSHLTYDDVVNEELASLVMADSEAPESLQQMVVENPSTT